MSAARVALIAVAVTLAAAPARAAHPHPALAIPVALGTGATAAAPFSAPAGSWWTIFADPTLDGLIARGESGATDIEEAAARLAQAEALVRAAEAARTPQAGLGASASGQSGALINAAGGVGALYNIGASLSYELDIFGRLAKANRAARLEAASRAELLRSARLLTEARIAETYFEVRAVDQESALLAATADSYGETLRITEGRRQSGLAAEAAVARATVEMGAVRGQALALERRRAQLEHALAFLVGEPAGAFHLARAEPAEAPPAVPAGLPSDLLRRRPDVAAAERSAAAAKVRIDLARTAWLPSLNLTATGGFASSDLVNLISSSARTFGAEALLSLPLFDGGRHRAGVLAARADAALAATQYRAQALNALREVEDQLSALSVLAEEADTAHATVRAGARATQLLESRYGDGLASRLEVLDARRGELASRRAEIQVRSARFTATVALIRALGGGWESPPAPAGD